MSCIQQVWDSRGITSRRVEFIPLFHLRANLTHLSVTVLRELLSTATYHQPKTKREMLHLQEDSMEASREVLPPEAIRRYHVPSGVGRRLLKAVALDASSGRLQARREATSSCRLLSGQRWIIGAHSNGRGTRSLPRSLFAFAWSTSMIAWTCSVTASSTSSARTHGTFPGRRFASRFGSQTARRSSG